MTLRKTTELSSALLDAAVARAEKQEAVAIRSGRCYVNWHEREDLRGGDEYNPSEAWALGGPIVERAGICLLREEGGWRAGFWPQPGGSAGVTMSNDARAGSALEAAMRAYASSRLGDAVDLD